MKTQAWKKSEKLYFRRWALALAISSMGAGSLLVACGKTQQDKVQVQNGTAPTAAANQSTNTQNAAAAAALAAIQNPGSQGAKLGNDNLLVKMDAKAPTSTAPPVLSTDATATAATPSPAPAPTASPATPTTPTATTQITWASQWTSLNFALEGKADAAKIKITGTWKDASGNTQTMPELTGPANGAQDNVLGNAAETDWKGTWRCLDPNYSDINYCETAVVGLSLKDSKIRAVLRHTRGIVSILPDPAPTDTTAPIVHTDNYKDLLAALKTTSVAEDAAGDVRYASVESSEILHGPSFARVTLIGDGNTASTQAFGWEGSVQAQMVNGTPSFPSILSPAINAGSVTSLTDATPSQEMSKLINSVSVTSVANGTDMKLVLHVGEKLESSEPLTLIVKRDFKYVWTAPAATATNNSNTPVATHAPACHLRPGAHCPSAPAPQRSPAPAPAPAATNDAI